jgi:hypothetical protein
MDPVILSAKFAACVWYVSCVPGRPAKEARRFARDNWTAFRGSAHRGVGQLLIRIRTGRKRRHQHRAGSAPALTAVSRRPHD